jgi:TPR repeat protein
LQSGSAEAAYQLHLLYQKPGYSMRNAGESQRYLGLAAERGYAHAQFALAVRMLRGLCGREARTDAAIWLKRAADQGHSLAAQKLSTLVVRTPIDCGPGSLQREALKLIGRKNLALAARLECGWVFGLSLLESIWVDFVRADRSVLLECDLSERGCRQMPVLILIENDIQREALALVKRRSTLDVPGADLRYSSRALAEAALRRYIERCGVEASVFLRQNGFHEESARRSVA